MSKVQWIVSLSVIGAFGLMACSGESVPAGPTAPATDSTSPSVSILSSTPEAAAGPRTVTDHSGAKVEIPAVVDAVAFEQIPLMSTYVAYFDGKAPNLVATSKTHVNMMEETILAEIAPEALKADTSFDNQGTINAETLLGIGPDVVFNNARNQPNRQAVEAVGLPVVGFDTMGAPTDTYVKWLRLLEDVYNEPGKNDAKIAYGEKLIDDAKQRTAKVPEAQKRSVAVVMRSAKGMLVVAGGLDGWFTDEWAKTLNFTNVTESSTEGQLQVNAEQLLAWDPDVILVAGKGMSSMTAAEILGNKVEGLDLSQLKAVRDGEVYSTELGMWNWFTPNPDAPVVANWLGSKLYPEQFADVDLVELTQAYYRQMYGHEVTPERAAALIDPDAGLR